ncbi:MAG: terpene cyclase/mutase family protein [Pirellulaceae bacterium]|nr:terpene cyclase/mutase family protein [Pirellulaceae bacterium]
MQCKSTIGHRFLIILTGLALVGIIWLGAGSVDSFAQENQVSGVAQDQSPVLPALSSELQQNRLASVGRGLNFLDGQQATDGSFASHAGTGPTSLAVAAMLTQGRSADHPVVAQGLQYLLANRQADGGIYAPDSIHKNYETSLAIMAFSLVNQGKTYATEIETAAKLLRQMQWGPNQGKGPKDMAHGGAGYGRHGRPDLSNTAFMIEALKAAGAKEDDPDIQAALAFVTRCQNHESEFNKVEFATTGPKDGGFFYTPAAGGQSMAGEDTAGGLRSYGSMTYAGLKSMLYAGVSKDDTRVQAAMSYLKKHYDIEANPGMGSEGLYYYYQMFGKAFQAMGEATFTDEAGKVHDWRADLIQELHKRQQANGSWYNVASDRWMEGDAVLVTSYALLALSYTK